MEREVHARAPPGDIDLPPTQARCDKHEHVGRAPAFVLVVITLQLSRSWRQRLAGFGHGLFAGLLEANVRAQWIEVTVFGVEADHLLRAPDKLRARRGDGPLFVPPRLEFVFLSARRTASFEKLST